MENYLKYAQGIGVSSEVINWLNHTLANYLEKKRAEISEVEHVIDYLAQNKVKALHKMSYPQALAKTKKWVEKLNKQAGKIVESKKDTKVVLKLDKGFKVVQLIGENAYKREGMLMSSCVASYFGRDTKIYSLRDKNNNPHCTMEYGQQIKGKGNGSIHPKYIKYVVKFLEWTGMEVRDSEMKNLGYVNVEKYKKYINTKDLFKNKYWYKADKLLDKKGNEFASLELWDDIPLIDETTLKINFNLPTWLPLSIDFLWQRIKTDKKNKNDSVISSKTDDAQIGSSGNYAQIGSSGYGAQIGSSGNYAQIGSSGYGARIGSSGDDAQIGSSGDGAQIEVKGENGVCAAIGYNSKIKGKLGTWITLAEYDNNNKPIIVKSAQIDGKKLRPNVWYTLRNKKFTEVKE
jgi:hypothetical protein